LVFVVDNGAARQHVFAMLQLTRADIAGRRRRRSVTGVWRLRVL
jgi:hypothetical protein